MANDLTGDFDVVAEFRIPAANRVLAAMHRGNRFSETFALLRVLAARCAAELRSGICLVGN